MLSGRVEDAAGGILVCNYFSTLLSTGYSSGEVEDLVCRQSLVLRSVGFLEEDS